MKPEDIHRLALLAAKLTPVVACEPPRPPTSAAPRHAARSAAHDALGLDASGAWARRGMAPSHEVLP